MSPADELLLAGLILAVIIVAVVGIAKNLLAADAEGTLRMPRWLVGRTRQEVRERHALARMETARASAFLIRFVCIFIVPPLSLGACMVFFGIIVEAIEPAPGRWGIVAVVLAFIGMFAITVTVWTWLLGLLRRYVTAGRLQ